MLGQAPADGGLGRKDPMVAVGHGVATSGASGSGPGRTEAWVQHTSVPA